MTWTGVLPILPAGTNIGVAFSGWSNINSALSESNAIVAKLPTKKYLSFGGGNHNGFISSATLQSLNTAILAGRLASYGGICYDVEEGDSGLATAFAQSFAIAKTAGLSVFVTISHSAPYAVPDKVALMASFFANGDIDIISPQLYTSGYELANDYTFAGVLWTDYQKSKAAVVVSIVKGSFYPDAQAYFAVSRASFSGLRLVRPVDRDAALL